MGTMADPRVFRLGRKGLARVFGELEARVMETLWSFDRDLSVQDVCDDLGPGHHYKTVMTVLNRLVQKGVLARRQEARAYLYQPRMSKDVFLKSVADSVLEGVVRDYGEVAITSFVDALEQVSPEALARLERLVHKRRSQHRDREDPEAEGVEHAP